MCADSHQITTTRNRHRKTSIWKGKCVVAAIGQRVVRKCFPLQKADSTIGIPFDRSIESSIAPPHEIFNANFCLFACQSTQLLLLIFRVFPYFFNYFLILINFDSSTGCFSLMRYSIKWYELTKFSYINAAAKRNKNDYAARKRKEKNCYRSNNGRKRQRTCKLIDERRPIKKIANLANERKVIYFYSNRQN